jgi:hypothetical protein
MRNIETITINIVQTLFGTVIFLFAFYIVAFAVGLLNTAVLTFICLFLIIMGFVYLLVRKAVVKRA